MVHDNLAWLKSQDFLDFTFLDQITQSRVGTKTPWNDMGAMNVSFGISLYFFKGQ